MKIRLAFTLLILLFSNGLHAVTFVSRVSTTPPEIVFDEGIAAYNPTFGNDNVLFHVSGYSVYNHQTSLISLFRDVDIDPSLSSSPVVYVYRVRADRNYYDVNQSLNYYIEHVATSDFERLPIQHFMELYGFENEVVTRGGISPTNIISAKTFTYDQATNRFVAGQVIQNPHYSAEETELNPNPYPLTHEDLIQFTILAHILNYAATSSQGNNYSIDLCANATRPSQQENSARTNALMCRELIKRPLFSIPINLLHNISICYQHSKNNCNIILNSMSSHFYNIKNNILYNLFTPEPNAEITAIGYMGNYVYIGTSTGNTYAINVHNDDQWWKQTPKINSLITAMSTGNATGLDGKIYLGTKDGQVFERIDGIWQQIGQLHSPITVMEFDDYNGGYLYVGTYDGSTYVRGMNEPIGTFWKLSGMSSSSGMITALKMSADGKYIFAGTYSGKVYKKDSTGTSDHNSINSWVEVGDVGSAVTNLENYYPYEMYLGTSDGNVYSEDIYHDTNWTLLGSPGGPVPVEGLAAEPDGPVWLLNNLDTLYSRNVNTQKWEYFTTLQSLPLEVVIY